MPDSVPPPTTPTRALATVAASGITLSPPRRLTLGWAANLIAAFVLLAVTSGAWVVAAILSVLGLLAGGSIVPVLALGATSLLLGRGWIALTQSVRARLRSHDLSEVEALPDAFHLLAPELQRLVRHTRTVRAGLQDPELGPDEVLRDAFEWVTAVAEVRGRERDILADRGLAAPALRAEVVALHDAADPRRGAVDLLVRFERTLLASGGDPFRGPTRQ